MPEVNKHQSQSTRESSWAESTFLLELLLRAERRRPRLDRRRVQEILDEAKVPVKVVDLEQRYWLRFVLDQAEIPSGLSMEICRSVAPMAGDEPTIVPEPELTALKLIYDARYDQGAPYWLTKDNAERLYLAHKGANRRMPSLEELIALRVLVPAQIDGVEGYDLLLGDDAWRAEGNRILARYWDELSHDASFASDQERFVAWLGPAAETTFDEDVAAEIDPAYREAFLTSVRERVLSEPDLLDPIKEPERIRWELQDVQYAAMSIEPVPNRKAGLLALYDWWHNRSFATVRHEARHLLNLLITLALTQEPAVRAVEFLDASWERPYLMYRISSILRWSGRESIANLLANLPTMALGMRLLDELELSESPAAVWTGQTTRNTEIAAQRKILWGEAIRVLLGTLFLTSAEPRSKAAALGEILIRSAKNTLRRMGDLETEKVYRYSANERLEMLFDELQKTAHELVLPLASELHTFLSRRASEKHLLSVAFESMPVPEIRILMWLLRILLLHDRGTASPIKPIVVAETIVSLYLTELERWITSDRSQVVSWLNDVPEAVFLPWADVAIVLHKVGDIGRLITPGSIDFGAHIKTAASNAQSLGDDEHGIISNSLVRAWANKERLHVRVLMMIHQRLRKLPLDPAYDLSQDECEALRGRVEGRLRAIIKDGASRATVPVPYLESDRGLTAQVVQCFNHFSATIRDVAFSEWIAAEVDPTVLLVIIEEALPLNARERATARLGELDIDRFLDEQFWISRIKQLAETANSAGQVAIAEKVLAWSEEHLRAESTQGNWELFAYRMRLMIAYQKRELDTLEKLAQPSKLEKYRFGEDTEDLDPSNTRSFYRALLLMETDPDESRRIFDRLLQQRPGRAAYAINRFAASINIARNLLDPAARRRASIKALHEWNAVRPSIPASSLADFNQNVAFLLLTAFADAEEYDDFDATWATLRAEQRANIDFIELGITNARHRGLHDRVNEILSFARPYYRDLHGKLDARFAALDQSASNTSANVAAHAVTTPGDEGGMLRQKYNDLRNAHAVVAVAAVGERKDIELHEYLYERLVEVGTELLEREAVFTDLKGEDKHNDVLVSFLKMRVRFLNWTVPDQPRGGKTLTGKEAGRRDWLVVDPYNPIAIFEGLCLTYVNTNKINEHVQKAAVEYNPNDLPFVYIVAYYDGKNWSDFGTGYGDHVRAIQIHGVSPVESQLVVPPIQGNIKVIRLVYNRQGVPLIVYHMLLNVGRN